MKEKNQLFVIFSPTKLKKECIIFFMEHIWEMPEIQALHRLPARSPLLPWADSSLAAQDAASGPENRDLSNNNFYKSLDGEWKFRFLESPSIIESEPELNGWTQKSYNDEGWNLIKVPGTWTRQGYDKPHYTNVQMPFENIPPKVPEQNPTGLYRLTFEVSSEWQGRRIVLHIGSAESVCMVWVNGRSAGCFKDTRLPSEFDITDYIDFSGELAQNTIALMVVRYSDASFVEDQDQWWFGGIHRSVYLYSMENMWIEDVEAVPDLCDSSADSAVVAESDGSADGASCVACGTSASGAASSAVFAEIPLKIRMGIKEDVPGNKKCSVSWKLYPVENAADMSSSTLLPPVAEGSEELACNIRRNLNEIRTKITVETPRIWSHENPNRYVLSLVLFDEDGRQIESCALCTAFRSVRTENRHLLINGKVVYIKGVNRHEHDEKTGKTLSTEAMVKDIQLLKAHNFNAVRTCHYPDDERWYELCDKYGIYLVDEANVENHYYYDGLCRSEMYSYAYMIRVQRMVRRDKNHPSIIMWSLGNESGHGWNQEMMYAWCHSFDKTRPVHYEGGTRKEYTQSAYSLETFARGKNVTDIVCPMYPDIQLVKEWAETTAGTDEKRPFIMCEYSHAMGNSNGSLSDYWDLIRSHDGLQGGFIWDWIDQGLEAFDEKGEKYWKYGGDFGDEPTDRDFCLNGILLPDQSTKPVMKECFKVFQPVEITSVDKEKGAVTVENRFDFTNLDCLSLKWRLEEDGASFAEGAVLLPAVAPGESVEVEVPFLDALTERLRNGAAFGDGSGEAGCGATQSDGAGNAASIGSGCGEIVLHADFVYNEQFGLLEAGTSAGWSEAVLRPAEKAETTEVTGLLAAAACEKKREELENNVFSSALVPSVFRCPTENDDQKTMPNTNRIGYEWVELLMDKTSWDEPSGIITADGKDIGSCNMKWSMVKDNSGKEVLELTMEFTLNDALPEYPKIGLTAKISSAYESVKWYGKGAHESYNDRCAGSALGCYTSKLHDMETPYIVPQENGNRYGVRWLEISRASSGAGNGGFRIESDTPFCFSVMHHEASDLWRCFHTNELTDTSVNGYYILNLDIAQRGVGTATCGPDTLEQYRIRPGVYKATFRFVF